MFTGNSHTCHGARPAPCPYEICHHNHEVINHD
jgi:hypothetical protein